MDVPLKFDRGFEQFIDVELEDKTIQVCAIFTPGESPPDTWHCEIQFVDDAFVVSMPGLMPGHLQLFVEALAEHAKTLKSLHTKRPLIPKGAKPYAP
jgi:hypothetical protein